ncbi:MAG: WG repeat-containing protein [Brevinema sp.]
MKKLKFLFLFLSALIVSKTFSQDQLYPFPDKGKWGYINQEGRIVLPARYESAGFFYDGLAKISIINERNEYLYGFINTAGKEIISPKFVAVSEFSGGVARVQIRGKYALLLPNGSLSGPVEYDYIYPATNGVSIFKKDSRYGYIDNNGNIIVNALYDRVFNFQDDMALVGRKERNKMYYGFINMRGEVVVPLKYEGARSYSEGFGGLYENRKWFYVNKKGQQIFEKRFDAIGAFYEGLARVRLNNEWGYINTLGEIVIPPMYKEADDFHNGFAIVGDGSYFSYISKSNKQIVPFVFTRATRFDGKLARVSQNNKNGFMNAEGRYNLTEKINSIGSFYHDRARMRVGRYYGYYDSNARVAIKPKYLYTSDFKGELAMTIAAIPGGYEASYINKEGVSIRSWKILSEIVPKPDELLYTVSYPNVPFYRESDPNSRLIIKANYSTAFQKTFQTTATPIIGHGLSGFLYSATYFGRPGFVFSEAISSFPAPKPDMGIYTYFQEKFGIVSETSSPNDYTKPMNTTFFNGSTLKRTMNKNMVMDTYFIPFMKMGEAFFIFSAAIGFPASEYPERSMSMPNFLSKQHQARFSGRKDRENKPLEFNISFDKERIVAKRQNFGVEIIHYYPIPFVYDTPKANEKVFESQIKQDVPIEPIQTNDMLIQKNITNNNIFQTNQLIIQTNELNTNTIILDERPDSTNNIDITTPVLHTIETQN